jgi:integrase
MKFVLPSKQKNSARIRFTTFVDEYVASTKQSERYKRSYRNVAAHIRRFEKHIDEEIYLDNFSEHVAQEFLYYLRAKGRIKGIKAHGKGLMLNTVYTIWSKVVYLLGKAAKQHNLTLDCDNIVVHREDANAIYLTLEELSRINQLKKLKKEENAVRDRFLLGCFTALRYGDYSVLTSKNIVGNNIEVKTRKTGAKVIIPIHPIVQEVFNRNGGELPSLPSQQTFCKIIKCVCKAAGINSEVLYERTVGHEVIRKRVKKYELVSSHTARRTAATNMYLAGIPIFNIMLITGHTTEQSFFKYIRINREENAKTLSKHNFFSLIL